MDFHDPSVKTENIGSDKAVPIRNLAIIDESTIQNGKFYRVTVQLGPNASWGTIRGSGKIFIAPKKNPMDAKERLDYRHIVNVFTVEPVPGNEVKGLISETRGYKQRNSDHETTGKEANIGEITRMCAIISAEEIKHVPANITMSGGLPTEMILELVNAKAEAAAMKIVTESMANKPGPGRPPKTQDGLANP